MSKIHIVTDSCAHFANAHFVAQNPVTIVPNKLTIDGETYREGIDITAEEALKLIARQSTLPMVTSPSTADFVEVYKQLIRSHDAIISIHPSRELFPSWLNAKVAAQQLVGQCEIIVVDSQTLCAAQGMLVQAAVKALTENKSTEDIVRLVRGAIDRVYALYYVETIGSLRQSKIISPSHIILGTLLGIKPLLTVENGVLTLIEKVKTRNQAVERLVEFAAEFVNIEDIVILQAKSRFNDQTRILQDRLTLEFPGRHFPFAVYSASLACLIGTDATGVVVLERETEESNHDF